MDVLLLAAGLGTRLRPLTEQLPKPLVPIAGEAMIEHVLRFLEQQGARNVVINTFYLAEKLEDALATKTRKFQVFISRETELLGTGGGLRQMLRLLPTRSDPVLVMNSDILFEPNLEALFAAHRQNRAIASMVIRTRPLSHSATLLRTDAAHRIQQIGEYRAMPPAPMSNNNYMFTGTHLLSRAAMADLPEQGCVIAHSYKTWLQNGEHVQGVVDESYFCDIGTLADYERAQSEFPNRGRRPSTRSL